MTNQETELPQTVNGLTPLEHNRQTKKRVPIISEELQEIIDMWHNSGDRLKHNERYHYRKDRKRRTK